MSDKTYEVYNKNGNMESHSFESQCTYSHIHISKTICFK